MARKRRICSILPNAGFGRISTHLKGEDEDEGNLAILGTEMTQKNTKEQKRTKRNNIF
jgi:hypothetical protein